MAVDVKRCAVQGFVRARRKTENVAPAAAASFVKILKNSKKKNAQARDLVIQGLLEEHSDNTYVEESDDEDLEHLRNEEMDNDEELQGIMDFVFGPDTDEEDLD